eukprot:CAMPEP_0168170008 /NCGR_PEP_ID=MMETSP0139_2-20121125/3941_1 /TAXON_ID=44445 /ORGANISM="Pseudo-nitzschia australis, Strain 10249 10 AB" /LENGTH=345 /DNA_ID=CAMNT_0008087463 /DNA_START=118 /DNA_END=1156 /DNA_ORIENTATION=+
MVTVAINTTLDLACGGANSNIPNADYGIGNGDTTGQPLSSFHISLLSHQSIRERELHEFSVYHNPSTSCYEIRITSFHAADKSEPRLLRLSFPTEKEAKIFGKTYSPPKMRFDSRRCSCCSGSASLYCKNCGIQMCETCSRQWAPQMVPRTYLGESQNATCDSIRVCKSCDWLADTFCMALVKGQYNNAVLIHETGNINLRCTCKAIKEEAMFPLHWAVMGGDLDIVKWLVETHGCPLFGVQRSPDTAGMLQSIQTSESRTLMDLAMTGGLKIDILKYLLNKGMDITDTNDHTLASKTFQALLSSENSAFGVPRHSNSDSEELASYVATTRSIVCLFHAAIWLAV